MTENSGKVLQVAIAISAYGILLFAIGFITGYKSDKDEMMEQYQSLTLQEQQDFIIAAIKNKHELRREIAEDWCAINPNTQRICRNARMNHPIRGVK